MRAIFPIVICGALLAFGVASAQDTAPTATDPLEGDIEAVEDVQLDEDGNPIIKVDRFGNPIGEDAPEIELRYDQYQSATLRALDKITGRATDLDVVADTPVVFGSLKVELKACFQTPPELPPEAAAFLSINSTQAVQVETLTTAVDASEVDTVSEDNPRLFSGWMFASSPGRSALEHPVYDIWVINCTAS